MKLICCTALVVLTSVVALSQTPIGPGPRAGTFVPKSGALLEITSNDATPVKLKIYDSQIHTNVVQTVPLGDEFNNTSNCNSNDLVPTDAYVLQGGSPTGCDPGDPFEVAQATGTATLSGGGYSFAISTQYLENGETTQCTSDATPQICAAPDTGFLTVTNTGGTFNGTIKLGGNSPIAFETSAFCPPGGVASDTFTGTLIGGNSVTLALSTDSSNCGGFNAPQTQTLASGVNRIFPFGKDDYQIKPLNASGQTLELLPVPIPAGPLGLNTWGTGKFGSVIPPNSNQRFSASNFSTTACVPYADFSTRVTTNTQNPVCVEIQLHCTSGDCTNLLYTAQNDYNIDGNSLPSGVGGPALLGRHTVNCPTTGFDFNIFLEYTAPSATTTDPLKGGGSGTGSCYVAAFDPNAGAISTGTTFSSFVGFQSPVSDSDENLVKAGSAVPLKWQLFSAPNVPLVENLHLCGNSDGSGCDNIKPWVFVGTVKTNCIGDTTPNDDLLDVTVPAGSAIQNFGDGTYQYNLNTKKGSTGCFTAVLIFDSGLTVFPANFKYK